MVQPKKRWRIVTSDLHSTVWDGEETLFDFNFLALGIDPDEAWKLANSDKRHLKEGQHLKVYYAENTYVEQARLETERKAKLN